MMITMIIEAVTSVKIHVTNSLTNWGKITRKLREKQRHDIEQTSKTNKKDSSKRERIYYLRFGQKAEMDRNTF